VASPTRSGRTTPSGTVGPLGAGAVTTGPPVTGTSTPDCRPPDTSLIAIASTGVRTDTRNARHCRATSPSASEGGATVGHVPGIATSLAGGISSPRSSSR